MVSTSERLSCAGPSIVKSCADTLRRKLQCISEVQYKLDRSRKMSGARVYAELSVALDRAGVRE